MSQLDISPHDRVHLKLHDSIPVHHIEIDIASKTPKQDDEEEEFTAIELEQHHNQQNSAHEEEVDRLMNMLTQLDNETSEEYERRKQVTRHQLLQSATRTSQEIASFIKFHKISSISPSFLNQVSLATDSDLIRKQLKDQDIQLMIKFLTKL